MSGEHDNRTRGLEERVQELRAENAALRESGRRWIAACAMAAALSCVAALLLVGAGELGGRAGQTAAATAADPQPERTRALPEPAHQAPEPARTPEPLALPAPEEPAAPAKPAKGGWTDLDLPRPEKPALPRVREAAAPEPSSKPFQLPEPAGAQAIRYKVQKDDTLSKISRRFYNSYKFVERIKRDNGLVSDEIHPGMILLIHKP